MSFPHDDPYWCAAADFLIARAGKAEAILAPDLFWWRFPKIYRYANTRLRPDFAYDWVVVHKGMAEELPGPFLKHMVERLKPAFANEVFVIYGARGGLRDNNHVRALLQQLPALLSRPEPAPAPAEEDPVLPEPGAIYKFADLDDEAFVAAMDEFYRHGGYLYTTVRDKTYYSEIDRYLGRYMAGAKGQSVLDLACGPGRLAMLASPDTRIVGVDVSGVAIEMARERHAGLANFSFERMDAHKLAFPDASFDHVLFVDAIEHVFDVEDVFAEAARVLKPGGGFFVTVANRDSVNQILTTKLGHPEFLTNYQHIREFAYGETLDLLARNGLALDWSAGIFLYPYWGVPGVDAAVRGIVDDDPEFVELMRKLGERIGAEHAYCSVVAARKR
jgi:SAM-dependent methyltransferase